ncbi:Sec-independent protein translocase subunit TatA [Tenggerimyces flavus]|uniref:Sec-independent protein translocase protein TatA n=1 Tax=Tenggerimyces flavus TaxID=1708749 RepID=A0ABV7Y5X8_9ACTN|nr:Sec-independent protein translocase subunit TatA [Tenggerimyces flavus]MBM7788260.1 sec-independent protein translocase protein TatA [Tenggerimyces flavus]
MPNLGPTEILLIIAVLVLLFGATRLPKIAAGLGESLRIFKKEIRTKDEDAEKAEKKDETPAPAAEATPPSITHTSASGQVPAQPVQEQAKDTEHTNR